MKKLGLLIFSSILISSCGGTGGSTNSSDGEDLNLPKKLSDKALPEYDQKISKEWTLVERQKVEANGNAEVMALKEKYPEYFKGLDSEDLASIYFFEKIDSIYIYHQPTVCKANDFRLKRLVQYYSMCGQHQKENTYWCMASGMMELSKTDPCATNP